MVAECRAASFSKTSAYVSIFSIYCLLSIFDATRRTRTYYNAKEFLKSNKFEKEQNTLALSLIEGQVRKRRKSSNDILDHMTVDIGEAEIATLVAVSQFSVVDA